MELTQEILIQSLKHVARTADEILETEEMNGDGLLRLEREIFNIQRNLDSFTETDGLLIEAVRGIHIRMDRSVLEKEQNGYRAFILDLLPYRLGMIFRAENQEEIAQAVHDIKGQIDHALFTLRI
ncbi:MAG: hypothetical protein ACSHX8_05555 [Opitutaceae bacterium]